MTECTGPEIRRVELRVSKGVKQMELCVVLPGYVVLDVLIPNTADSVLLFLRHVHSNRMRAPKEQSFIANTYFGKHSDFLLRRGS